MICETPTNIHICQIYKHSVRYCSLIDGEFEPQRILSIRSVNYPSIPFDNMFRLHNYPPQI